MRTINEGKVPLVWFHATYACCLPSSERMSSSFHRSCDHSLNLPVGCCNLDIETYIYMIIQTCILVARVLMELLLPRVLIKWLLCCSHHPCFSKAAKSNLGTFALLYCRQCRKLHRSWTFRGGSPAVRRSCLWGKAWYRSKSRTPAQTFKVLVLHCIIFDGCSHVFPKHSGALNWNGS